MGVFIANERERRRIIPGYRSRYEVSDLGRVYSGGNEMSLVGGRYVRLCRDGSSERRDVAYLVARAFVANPEGREFVWHADGDYRNNRADNLEWHEERQSRRGRRGASVREVLWYDLEGNCLGKFPSLKAASEETGVARSLIRNCAEGRAKRAKKWRFRYA